MSNESSFTLVTRSGLEPETLQDLFHQGFGETAIGLEFGRKTIAGPLLLGAHWCQDRGFGVTLGFGLVF